MKILFLFAVAITLLFATNSSKSSDKPEKKNAEPSCCIKKTCDGNKNKKEDDNIFIFQPSPFHI